MVKVLTRAAIKALFPSTSTFHRSNSGSFALAQAMVTGAPAAAAAAHSTTSTCNPTVHGTAVNRSAQAIVNQEFNPLADASDLPTPIDWSSMQQQEVDNHRQNINSMGPMVPGLLGYSSCGLDKTWKDLDEQTMRNCANKGALWTQITQQY